MIDRLSLAERSKNMAAIKSKDMKPEIAVRSWLHRHGFRYRLHGAKLPGKPDIVFQSRKKVVFVHGCFWHQHNDEKCLDGRKPKSRTEYWHTKLDANVARDAKNTQLLQNSGWDVMIVWECETKRMDELGPRIAVFLGESPRRSLNQANL